MSRESMATLIATFALTTAACDDPAASAQSANNTETDFALSLAKHISEADANDCGDINSILVFDVEGYPIVEWSGRVELTKPAMETLRQALSEQLAMSLDGQLVIKSRHDHAVNGLITDLGLYEGDYGSEQALASCHDMSVLEHFKLSPYEGALESYAAGYGKSYLTVGLLEDGGFDASLYDIHLFMDADANRLVAFLIW